jgi:hypothetical protein
MQPAISIAPKIDTNLRIPTPKSCLPSNFIPKRVNSWPERFNHRESGLRLKRSAKGTAIPSRESDRYVRNALKGDRTSDIFQRPAPSDTPLKAVEIRHSCRSRDTPRRPERRGAIGEPHGRACTGSGSAGGKTTVKRLPTPSASSVNDTCAPWMTATSRTIAKPSPLPSAGAPSRR